MAVRIDPSAEGTAAEGAPLVMDLAYGVTVTTRPLTDTHYAVCEAEARRAVEGLRRDARARREAGLPLGDLPDPDDAALWDAQYQRALIVALGGRTIMAWEGVTGPDGAALPVTPAAVRAVLDLYPLGGTFYGRLTADTMLRIAAGNGFGPSRDGTGGAAEGRPIAPPAASPTAPAAGASADTTDSAAPTTSTSPETRASAPSGTSPETARADSSASAVTAGSSASTSGP